MRRRVNLFRYCYLCLMSTNCLFEHTRARPRACAWWMQVSLTTFKGAWPRRPVRTLRPRPRLYLRLRPRVVYPVFCSNANGSRRVDVLTRTEPVGRPRRRLTVRGKANARFQVCARDGYALMQMQTNINLRDVLTLSGRNQTQLVGGVRVSVGGCQSTVIQY